MGYQRGRAGGEGGGDRQQDRVTCEMGGQRKDEGSGEAQVAQRVVGRREPGKGAVVGKALDLNQAGHQT